MVIYIHVHSLLLIPPHGPDNIQNHTNSDTSKYLLGNFKVLSQTIHILTHYFKVFTRTIQSTISDNSYIDSITSMYLLGQLSGGRSLRRSTRLWTIPILHWMFQFWLNLFMCENCYLVLVFTLSLYWF